METACVTAENYIIQKMFRWFRQQTPARETAVAMVDPRPGDEVLVVGASDPRLAANCAAITGLNGRTVVVGRSAEEQRKIEHAAGQAGALVEFLNAPPAMLPLETDVFDVVVLPSSAGQTSADISMMLEEAVRVAKPAGRIIVITGEKRAGLFGALQSDKPALPPDKVLALLRNAGTVAARRLASVDGVSYFEARKPRL